ncbi:MAG: Spy/CpxP family protein refolding chaperone [Ferruginibacter sp.]
MIKKATSSDRIFIVIIAVLLLANMATLVLLLSNKKDNRDDHKSAMRSFLKNEIGFSDAQLVQFDSVKSLHRRQVKVLFDNLRREKQENLKKLGMAGFGDSAVNSAAAEASAAQRDVELRMLSHLKEVRNLCTPSQQVKFDTGFYKIMTKGAAGAKRKEN